MAKRQNTPFGLPYMGRKAKISKDIVDKILEIKPNTEYVYDLFGGGGSISFEFAQRPNIKKVFYNDKDTALVLLLRKLLYEGFNDSFLQWVSPEEYKARRYELSWFGGLLHVVWSFGNNRAKHYLYSKKSIFIKQLLHNIIINRDIKAIKQLETLINHSIPQEILNISFWYNRKLELLAYLKKTINRLYRTQHLISLHHLYRIATDFKYIEKLELFSQDYQDIKIETPIDKTIIYLDPPYKGVAKYSHSIDYVSFCEYIKDSKYPIFLSSYENICNLELVWQKEKIVLLSSYSNNIRKVEKLFYKGD